MSNETPTPEEYDSISTLRATPYLIMSTTIAKRQRTVYRGNTI
jgi:hypothetical protein